MELSCSSSSFFWRAAKKKHRETAKKENIQEQATMKHYQQPALQQHKSPRIQLAVQLCYVCPRASCGGGGGGCDGEQSDRPSDTPLISAPATEGYQEVTAAARGETS